MLSRSSISGLLLGLLVGFGGAHLLRPAPPPAEIPIEAPTETPVESPLEKEARDLLTSEAAAIAALSDRDEKLRWQDELLEKILKLFLIDVGLRLERRAREPAPAVVAAARPAPVPPPPPAPTPVKREDTPQDFRRAAEQARQRNRLYARIVGATDANSVRRELREIASPDLGQDLKNSTPVPAEKALELVGSYEGNVRLNEGNERWNMTMSIEHDPTREDEGFVYEVRLGKNGRPFSTTRGRGSLKNFRYQDGDVPQIYIEMGGNYSQLFPAPEIPGFIGIFYESTETRELKAIGRITLRKLR